MNTKTKRLIVLSMLILMAVGAYLKSVYGIYALTSSLWFYTATSERYVKKREPEHIVLSYILAGLFFLISLCGMIMET